MGSVYAGEAAALRDEVREAVRSAEEYNRGMEAAPQRTWPESIVLFLAVVTTAALFLFVDGALLFWIVASFYLYMFHPLAMFVPSGGADKAKLSKEDLIEYTRYLRDVGAIKETVTTRRGAVAEVFWNLFFINSQPLAPGFWLIYSLDILFVLILTATGETGWQVAAIVGVQSIAIIAFYIAIWHMKPYSPGFFGRVLGLRHDLKTGIAGGVRSGFVALLVIGGVAAVAGILVVSAMLLPGMTLGRLLDVEAVSRFRTFLPVVPLLLAQFVFLRALQGRYSRSLLLEVNRTEIEGMKEHLLPAAENLAVRAETEEDDQEIADELTGIRKTLIQLSAYRPERHCLGGHFSVYAIVPNIGIILTGKKKRDKEDA
ncbi:hypothetical protein E2N92_10010 [Methanofollis formosanus]|uniref:Uncharacterized protein n=1 Tax=Methanofollis formosanus TaxID=299308 RepID=A0A8G1A3F6_9EURY|nr:hypothetical protein [Methanofollis formosanus]QYZ79736.1 hypothetical protein E2N92_10010 [Methanofollis formosanus]